MKRYLSVIVILIVASGAFAAESKPNIVYILTDQWRGYATGYAKDPNVKTPHTAKYKTARLQTFELWGILQSCGF